MHLYKFIAIFTVFALPFIQAYASDGVMVEWAPFTVNEGVTSDRLIRAAQNVEDGFLKKQKGYIKRALLKGKEGSWVDIVYWQSEEDANTAATAAIQSPICFEYFALMKGAEHSEVSNVQHFEVVKSWH